MENKNRLITPDEMMDNIILRCEKIGKEKGLNKKEIIKLTCAAALLFIG